MKRRLGQVHELQWVRGQRRSDSMVLEMCIFVAHGAQIAVTAISDEYISNS